MNSKVRKTKNVWNILNAIPGQYRRTFSFSVDAMKSNFNVS